MKDSRTFLYCQWASYTETCQRRSQEGRVEASRKVEQSQQVQTMEQVDSGEGDPHEEGE